MVVITFPKSNRGLKHTIWKVRSVYISEDDNNISYFHLHPELVTKYDNTEETNICAS